MSRLPFSRIAILEPSLTFSCPEAPSFDRRMQGELASWLAQARVHDADACYARVHAFTQEAASGVLQWLSKEIPLLVPSKFVGLGVNATAYHHRSSEKAILPSGNYLQGISCHDLEEVMAAENAGYDYVFLSPVHSTASHPEAIALGLQAFREITQASRVPIFAMGGIDAANAPECIEAGAAGWAGIRAFMK